MSNSFLRFLLATAVAAVLMSGCSSSVDDVPVKHHPDSEYGYTKEKAIEVCKPAGQRQYLCSLLCKDGLPPTFARTGNVGMRHDLDIPEDAILTPQEQRELAARIGDGDRILAPGELDIHIVDRYEVDCRDRKVYLFLDMYHCAQSEPEFAPAGFGMMQ